MQRVKIFQVDIKLSSCKIIIVQRSQTQTLAGLEFLLRLIADVTNYLLLILLFFCCYGWHGIQRRLFEMWWHMHRNQISSLDETDESI